MSTRDLINRMVKEGAASLQKKEAEAAHQAKRKARQAYLSAPVTCALCKQEVPRKTTLPTPLGPACKKHPGVA